MKIHITNGNKKLPKTILNFSLPPEISCPKATKECKNFCYAKKAWKQYPNVQTAWMENLKLSKTNDFVQLIVKDLNRKKWKQFRISQAGDFYNQKYLDKWIAIASRFCDKIFYAYTKSYHLDFSKRPKNMIVLLSDDDGKWKKHYKNFDGIAHVVENNSPSDKLEWNCLGNCKVCNYCYTNTSFKIINFRKH